MEISELKEKYNTLEKVKKDHDQSIQQMENEKEFSSRVKIINI